MTQIVSPEIKTNSDDQYYPIQDALKKSQIVNKDKLSSLDLFLNSKIFCIVSNTRRRELTDVEVVHGKKIKKDKLMRRRFSTALGYTVFISGPLLSMDDAATLEVVLKMYYEGGFSEGKLSSTYRGIAEKIGYKIDSKKGLGGSVKEKIELSLVRLRTASIEIHDESGELVWIDNILTSLKPQGRGRGLKLAIEISKDFITQYKKDQFFVLDINILNLLDGDWEKAIYRLACAIKESFFKISIEALFNLFHENELVPSKINSAKFQLNNALSSLISKGVLTDESSIDESYNIVICPTAGLPPLKDAY